MAVQVLIVFMLWLFGSSCEECPISYSQTRNSGNMECSESWCNGSQTCSGTQRDGCPPGLLCKDSLCECPDQYPSIAKCDSAGLLVIYDGFCWTLDENNETIQLGHCIYNSAPFNTMKDPTINNSVCNSYNRTGALCGRCLPDHYPLVYSFSMTCIPCPHARWNWFGYIMAAYLPLTLFYFFILFFKLNTTTSHFFVVVSQCQLLSLPFAPQILFITISKLGENYIAAIQMLLSLYGIWNLDFFRPFYSDLCLGISILPTLALDYVIAVYPLLLLIITYLLIVLYDKNYRVITVIWRPFQFLVSLLRKNLSFKTSLIDAFSTFFLLSNVKFISVSFALLCPVQVYRLQGDNFNYTFGLYYAGDIEYFGSEHLPYAILAIAVLCVFVILPITVLALYPFSFFQKFLNIFPFRWYILHTFMDSFLGNYKDGTEPGTRDCRWFASFFFITRIFLFLAYTIIDIRLCIVVGLIILIIHIALLVIFQPYKQAVAHLNAINIISVLFVTLFFTIFIGGSISSITASSLKNFFFVLVNILAVVPQLYIVITILYWIYTHRLFCLGVMQRLKAWRNGYDFISEDSHHLPDRIENPSAYHRENLASFAT